MAKQTLNGARAFELKQALHIAVLEALMASRRWEPGQLVFQGGTSLHLAHGSPRFSEDLYFLVDSALDLQNVAANMQARLQGVNWLPAGTELTVSKAKDDHNPHAFTVSVSGKNVIGSVKVKVELWQTASEAMKGLQIAVAPIQIATGPASGLRTHVPTAELSEIYADKVFAVVARKVLKPRDVFDLHWLAKSAKLSDLTSGQMNARFLTYPNMTRSEWLSKASARIQELSGEQAHEAITNDLKRWLPSTWPISPADSAAMAQTAIAAIQNGTKLI